LKEETRESCRLTILSTICLLIRVKLLRHIERVPEGLKIYVSQDQIKARDGLFDLYLGGAEQSELHLALHTLLVSILCHSTNNNKLACPTDYSVCLDCLEKADDVGWKFKKPSRITGKFSQLQFCFRMIYFTHCYTIACNGGIYKPLSSLLPTTPIPPATAHTPSSITPNSSHPKFILLEVEVQAGDEVTLEVVGIEDSQPLGYEEEIEIADDEQDNRDLVQ